MEQLDVDSPLVGRAKKWRSMRIPPWLTGLLVIAGLTFILGYYLPLRSANAKLTKQFSRLAGEYQQATTSYGSKSKTLSKVQAVSNERKQKLGKIADAESAAKKALATLEESVESQLEKLVDSKIVSVEKGESSVNVTIESRFLIYPHKTFVHARGGQLLCQIAKAIPEGAEHPTTVVGHANTSVPPSSILKKQFESSWQLSAIMASEVATKIEDCGIAGKNLRAVGAAHFEGDPKQARKSAAQFEIQIHPSS